ncbi:MAG TPA: hypothetical protein V6C84_22660 [Coleofasciculaceae cyanobacterium]
MLGKNRTGITQRLLAALLAVILSFGLGSCSTAPSSGGGRSARSSSRSPQMVKLSEVPPPIALRELRQDLDAYQPQVKILSPRSDEVLQDTEVSVRFQAKDMPLFLNEEFGLGPHLHVIVDNQPYTALYDTSEPMILKDLEPGTHTIRAFASRPWHESFKNEGAYAQTTFHVFTKTPEHNPDPQQPLLTYSRPKGSYGAEPIMLDFYLANAPLHLVANQDMEDDILDWQVRCTINGESFIVDRWEPIYLKGLKPGKTWVQLELLDENGNPYPNAFNNTVRLIDYQPGGTDTLSKLVRGELSAAEARSIVDRDYVYQPEPPIEPDLPELTPIEPVVPEFPESQAPESPTEPIVPESPTSEPPISEEPQPEIPSASEPTLESLPEIPPAPAILPPELLPPIVSPPDVEPAPNLKAPSSDLPIQMEAEIKADIEETVKQQLPDAVEKVLEDKNLELSPAEQPIAPDLLDRPAPAAPPIVPLPADQPLLRQWRDRLKQVVPLPEPDKAEAKPFFKAWSDRAKDFLGGTKSPDLVPEPVQEPDSLLKLPEIIDVPPPEKLDIQIAEPEPKALSTEPAPAAKALQSPVIEEAIEPPTTDSISDLSPEPSAQAAPAIPPEPLRVLHL